MNETIDVAPGLWVWRVEHPDWDPDAGWEQHFKFARAASAYSIQHLGNEASLPTLAQINETAARFGERQHAPPTLELVSDTRRDATDAGKAEERPARRRK